MVGWDSIPLRRSCHLGQLHLLTKSACADETTLPGNRRFLIQVDATLESLSKQEDTDGNMQITIEDNGPKVCAATMFRG